MSRRPPAFLVFFIDRSLGARVVPAALRVAGRRVEIHDEHFPTDAADTDWIPVVASKGWIILTRDERIARNPLEVEALLYSGARAFVLTSSSVTGPEQAEILVGHLAKIERLVGRKRGAFIARVNRTGVQMMKTGLPRRRS